MRRFAFLSLLSTAGCAGVLGLDAYNQLGPGAKCGELISGWECASGLVCDAASKTCVAIAQGGGGSGGSGGSGGGGSGGGGSACMDGAACYSGPPGTETVGNCSAGMQVCSDPPSCAGEMVPDPNGEDCYSTGDEDCDGAACSDLVWAKEFQGAAVPHAIAHSPSSVLVGGRFQGMITFSGDAMDTLNGGAGSYFFASFDADGNHEWSVQPEAGGSGGDCALAAIPGSRWLAACHFEGVITLGGQTYTPTGVGGVLIVRFDTSGVPTPLRYVDGMDRVALAIGPGGETYVAGGVGTTPLDFGTLTVPDSGPGDSTDAILVRIDDQANAMWVLRYDDPPAVTPQPQRFLTVAVGANGEVAVGGEFTDDIDMQLEADVSDPGQQIFGVGVDPATGAPLWEIHSEDPGMKRMIRVAVDPMGNSVFLSDLEGDGAYKAYMGFGVPVTTTGAGDNDFVLWKVAPNGGAIWTQPFGDAGYQSDNDFTGQSIAVDSTGRIVFGGCLQGGSIDFGSGIVLTPMGTTDAFLAVLEPDGSLAWAKRYGDLAALQIGYAVDVDAADNIYATYLNTGTMDFSGGTAMPAMAGGFEGVLAKLQP